MRTIFNAADAFAAMSAAADELSSYALALFAMLAGTALAVRWFKFSIYYLGIGRVDRGDGFKVHRFGKRNYDRMKVKAYD